MKLEVLMEKQGTTPRACECSFYSNILQLEHCTMSLKLLRVVVILDQKAHYVFDLFVVVGRGGTNSLMFVKFLVFCDVW